MPYEETLALSPAASPAMAALPGASVTTALTTATPRAYWRYGLAIPNQHRSECMSR
jgi:hypothetical protein